MLQNLCLLVISTELWLILAFCNLLFGPLIGHNHISVPLPFHNVSSILDAFNSSNHIVNSCMQSAFL